MKWHKTPAMRWRTGFTPGFIAGKATIPMPITGMPKPDGNGRPQAWKRSWRRSPGNAFRCERSHAPEPNLATSANAPGVSLSCSPACRWLGGVCRGRVVRQRCARIVSAPLQKETVLQPWEDRGALRVNEFIEPEGPLVEVRSGDGGSW